MLPLLWIVAFIDQAPSPAEHLHRWTQDIDFLVQSLSARGVSFAGGEFASRGQKDFEKVYPPSTFQPAIQSLKNNLPHLSSQSIVLELMRIVATANISHNNIGIPGSMGFENRLPITLRWYPDGLAVVAATPAYADSAGLRVLKIGNITPEQLLQSLTPFIAQENKVWPKIESERLLPTQPFYAHLKLLDQNSQLPLTLERPGQQPLEITIPFTTDRTPQTSYHSIRKTPPQVYGSSPGSFYWHRYLQDSQTLFIRYDAGANDPKLPMKTFASQVAEQLDTQPIQRVVLDFRFNGGGNERAIKPLKDVLTNHPKSKANLYVLIGPRTFSSAIDNAIALKRTGATLVGEPTGGRPSAYGEVKTINLPNSKLLVRFTTKYDTVPAAFDFDELRPDIAAPNTFAESRAGRDPGLSAAIAAK